MPKIFNGTFLEWLAKYCTVEPKGFATECWTWTGATSKGYARAQMPKIFGVGQKVRVHREAYKQIVGPIPGGLVLDHLCRNRACCNPHHLEVVTVGENTRRGLRNVKQSHCKRGHELTPENRVKCARGTQCRKCVNISQLAAYYRRKAA